MNRILILSLIASALVLTACGADQGADSNDSSVREEPKSNILSHAISPGGDVYIIDTPGDDDEVIIPTAEEFVTLCPTGIEGIVPIDKDNGYNSITSKIIVACKPDV